MPPVRRRERHNLLRRGLLCGWLGAQLAAQMQMPSPVLSGRVVDEQGAPLAGVAVCLLDESHGTPRRRHRNRRQPPEGAQAPRSLPSKSATCP
jgi:hypothetical protein